MELVTIMASAFHYQNTFEDGLAQEFRKTLSVDGIAYLYIVLGDSIALGWPENSGSPDETTPPPYDEAIAASKIFSNPGFTPLESMVTTLSTIAVSPIVGLGYRLAQTLGDHYLVQHAVGGSKLTDVWQSPSGTQYVNFITKLDAAIAELVAQGKQVVIRGSLIALGTNDSVVAMDADAVKGGWDNLLDALDNRYGSYYSNSYKHVLSAIAKPSGFNFSGVTYIATRQAVAERSNCLLLKNFDYTTSDGTHYSEADSIDMGIRAANSINGNISDDDYAPGYDIKANIDTLYHWDANEPTSLVLESAPAQNLSSIIGWRDQQADITPTMNVDGDQPSIIPNWKNGRDWLQFAGDTLVGVLPAGLTPPFALLAATEIIGTPSGTVYALSFGDTTGFGNSLGVVYRSNGFVQVFDGATNSGTFTWVNGDSHVIYIECKDSGSPINTIHVNGVDGGSTSPHEMHPNANFVLGGYAPDNPDDGLRCNHRIGEIYVFGEIPSTEKRDAAIAELMQRHAIT